MPGGDQTGPYSEGPMTGRRLGYCGGKANRGFRKFQHDEEAEHGRFFGRGRGHRRGHGFRHSQLNSDKP